MSLTAVLNAAHPDTISQWVGAPILALLEGEMHLYVEQILTFIKF
jgi:hypothetical protein